MIITKKKIFFFQKQPVIKYLRKVKKKKNFRFRTVILAVIATVIVASLYDVCCVEKGEEPKSLLPQILLTFSMPSNLKKLCGPAHEDLKFECISGIKFLTMVFIIAGHTLIFIVSGPVLNKKFWQEVRTLFFTIFSPLQSFFSN